VNILYYHIDERDRKLEEQRSFHEKEMSDMWGGRWIQT
jgi:hypothetical protein